MKLAFLAAAAVFAAAMLMGSGNLVFAQSNTTGTSGTSSSTTKSTNSSSTGTSKTPSGAPSTGFGY